MARPVLPHAPPMHWLDTAELSADGRTATATRIIAPDHAFLDDGYLLASALIEMMAQAAAAGSVLLAQSQNRKVPRGRSSGDSRPADPPACQGGVAT